MDRKDFLATACALCGAGTAMYFMQGCTKTAVTHVNFTLDLTSSSNAALANTGGYVIANGGNTFVQKTATGYLALSLICTHQGCTVAPNGSGFRCPCHGGTYSATGAVTGGPPPSALPQYTVSQSGNILTIAG